MSTSTNTKKIGMSLLKVGTLANGNRRIWIHNANKLADSFKIGDPLEINFDKEKRTIVINKSSRVTGHKVAERKASNTPIIDLKNNDVSQTMQDAKTVEVVFYHNKIVITVSKEEIASNNRDSKNGVNIFELFAGGGTLSNQFKKSGFNIVGGLEYEDKYLQMFEKNHGKDAYTIMGSIEDVNPSDYPDNVDVVLAGIPCTTFTSANLKMQKELKAKEEGLEYCEDTVDNRLNAEAMVYYVAAAIRQMRPHSVVIEEVVGFSNNTIAVEFLRTILKSWNYHISEAVTTGTMSKRKRWAMVASSFKPVNISNITQESETTISDILEISVEDRDWKHIDDMQRLSNAKRKSSVGVRYALPGDKKCNTFTTHNTRSTEPALRRDMDSEFYSEFTNEEIKRIHGLENYELPKSLKPGAQSTVARQILGQGVTDQWIEIATLIKDAIPTPVNTQKEIIPICEDAVINSTEQIDLFSFAS